MLARLLADEVAEHGEVTRRVIMLPRDLLYPLWQGSFFHSVLMLYFPAKLQILSDNILHFPL